MQELDALSIEELQNLIAQAKKEIMIRNRRLESVRLDMEKAARSSGLSPEEAAILFGER